MGVKGITKACSNPACKKIIIRFASFKSEGSFQMKCPHCQQTQEVTVTNKMEISARIIIVVLIIAALAFVNAERDASPEYVNDTYYEKTE